MKKRQKKLIITGLSAAVVVALIIVAAALFFPKEKKTEVAIYFYQNEKLVETKRPLRLDESPLKKAFTELLAGPRLAEREAGLSTLIPARTRLLSLRVKGGTAIVNLSRQLENYGGGSNRLEGLIAQIVYTGTALPGINKVWIWMEGEKELVLGGEGLVLDRPLSRKNIFY